MLTRTASTWITLLIGEACLAALTVGAFWFQDWRYSLPTPKPVALQQKSIGEQVSLPLAVGESSRPTLLHFFNPACPCSRFNLNHVSDLIARFDGRVRVVAVLETSDETAALKAFESLGLDCEAVADPRGEIAASAGVYSTPQGVVLDSHSQLYYRGNYNRGRYCTAVETEFVRLSIEDCLAHLPPPHFPAAATVAVGCELPTNALTDKSATFIKAKRQ